MKIIVDLSEYLCTMQTQDLVSLMDLRDRTYSSVKDLGKGEIAISTDNIAGKQLSERVVQIIVDSIYSKAEQIENDYQRYVKINNVYLPVYPGNLIPLKEVYGNFSSDVESLKEYFYGKTGGTIKPDILGVYVWDLISYFNNKQV